MRAALLLRVQTHGSEPALGWPWASYTLSSEARTHVASPSVPFTPLDMLRDTARGCWDQLTRVEVGGVSALTFGAGADGAKVRLWLHPEPGSTRGCWCQTCGTTEHACVSGARPPDPLPSPHLCFSGWKGLEGWGGSGLPSPMGTGPVGGSLTFR